ncbi:MAG: nucleotidyltransferase domain-containing protein [Deltaproteobacteria bacterium]|nr:nucleotidyltransferase domain-containing protein [Deltaproteobacteria bacterium]
MESENKNLLKLKELVTGFLKDEKVTILVFGSRARKENLPFSDVDIGIMPHNGFSDIKLALLREKIEDSSIPYKVDIVNLAEVSQGFRKEVLKDAVIWKD